MEAVETRKTVKGQLAEIKDLSELMVDLAYAAVFFSDLDLAREVGRLEEQMHGDLHDVRKLAILAARSPEDAEHMVGVLAISSAIERISDAAADIARVAGPPRGALESLIKDLRYADEIVSRLKVAEGSAAAHRTLRDLALPVELGVWVIATRQEGRWRLDPDPDQVLYPNLTILVRGPEDGVNEARQLMGVPRLLATPEPPQTALTDLDRAVDLLVEMKNSAEVAVGLAYSALLFNDKALATEVAHLEERSDTLHHELESWVLRSSRDTENPDDLRGLLHLANASEMIFDSAREMTRLVEQGEELHPVIAAALVESDEVGHETVVASGSAADTRSIKDLAIESETGMFILAVQRGRRWIYRPKPSTILGPGDRLIAIGPPQGGEELDRLVGMVLDPAELGET
ncbi:MAG: potassium channel protein [Actinomycetota bacterium]|nr:potassium channel protein [Actinomycetota bacterium]